MTQTFYMVPASHHGSIALWLALAFGLAAIAALLYTASAPKRIHYSIADGVLKIRGDLYRRTLPIRQIDTNSAQTVALSQRPDLRPSLRRLGTGMPGYCAGWFSLAGGGRALVYLTNSERVLYAPVHDGSSLLLSVDRPEEFLSALRLAVVDSTVEQSFAMPPGSNKPMLISAPIAVVVLGVLFFILRTFLGGGRAEYQLSPSSLHVHGDYSTEVSTSALDLDGAHIINFGADTQLRPALRTNGIGLPGYRAGWFRLKDGERAFLCLTDPNRAVYVPTRAGYALELSVENPEEFLSALRQAQAKPL